MTPQTQMYCAECLREIPVDAPRWYAVEDQAKIYACCSELCAFGSEHADPVNETPVADGAKSRQPTMESKLRELANATPEFAAAVIANCKTHIFLTNQKRESWARAAPNGSNGRSRAGGYAGYFSERRLYAEQVERYWRRARLAAPPMAGLMAVPALADECAGLRVKAERTRYRVSTWRWPYTWCLRLDRAWARIEPDPSEPTEPMEAFERACAYRRLGKTPPRGAQMLERPIWSVIALLLSAGALAVVWRSGVPWYVFAIACCLVVGGWCLPPRRQATALAPERVRKISADIALEDTATRGLRELRKELRAFDAETASAKSAAPVADICDQRGGSEPKTTIDLYRMLEEQSKSNDRPN